VLAVVVVLAALVAVGVVLAFPPGPGGRSETSDYHLDEKSFDGAALRTVEKRIGVKLPAGARGLHLLYEGSGVDPAFIAKIEVPAKSAKAFATKLAALPNGGLTSIDNPMTGQVTWWNPVKANVQVERLFDPTGRGDGLHLLLCSEGQRRVLYVMWVQI
jgi:hypothetical protein